MAETENSIAQQVDKYKQLPLSAKYAFVARTQAVLSDNALGTEMIDFMRAERISRQNDTWKVMSFQIYDDENKETRFKSRVIADNVNFIQAMEQLAVFERQAREVDSKHFVELDIAKKPFLKKDFFEIEHYVSVSEREGVVFDRSGTPHVKNEGRVVSEGNFLVKDLARADQTEEVSRLDAADGIRTLEKGVLAEMFHGVSAKGDFNATLMGFNVLGFMDHVVHSVLEYSFYMNAYLGNGMNVDSLIRGKVGVDRDEERQVRDFFSQLAAMDKDQLIENSLRNLATAESFAEKIEKAGAYAGHIKKFLAQCAVATHVIQGQVTMESLKASRNDNTGLVRKMEDSANAAERKFREMGATDGEVRVLKSAILKGGQPQLPAAVDDFVRRYKVRRDGMDAKLKEAQKKGESAAAVISADPNAPGTVLVSKPPAI